MTDTELTLNEKTTLRAPLFWGVSAVVTVAIGSIGIYSAVIKFTSTVDKKLDNMTLEIQKLKNEVKLDNRDWQLWLKILNPDLAVPSYDNHSTPLKLR